MLKKKIFIPLYIFIFLYVGFGSLLFIFQNDFFYPAGKTAFDDCPKLEKAEKIKSEDFRAYFLKRSPEKVVVYYHGNAGRACDRYYMEKYFEAWRERNGGWRSKFFKPFQPLIEKWSKKLKKRYEEEQRKAKK